jgi:hypothetical protein
MVLIWKWALAHWPGPIHPAGSNPTGQDLGRSNRPRPASNSHLSLSSSYANPSRRRCRPAFLPASGDLRHRHLGQTLRLSVLYPLLQLDLMGASSPRRSVAGFPTVSANFGCLRLDASPSPLLVLDVRPLVVVMCVCTPVEAPRCGAPGVLGEDIPG